MRQFLTLIGLFSIPVLLGILSFEFFIRTHPNTFNSKAKHIQNNTDIEILFLGSSHTQDGINPEFLKFPSANLAYSSQDYQLDSALYFSYVDNLKNLKVLVLELDYHSLEERNESDYFRLPWYRIFHSISISQSQWQKLPILYFSSPTFFNNYIKTELSPLEFHYELNEYGVVMNDSFGPFYRYDYNKEVILSTAEQRLLGKHKTVSKENSNFNSSKFKSIIDDALARDIAVVIASYPVYESYKVVHHSDKLARWLHFRSEILKQYPVIEFTDFSVGDKFEVTDFLNDDHLNVRGSRKLTELMNLEIERILADKNEM